MCLSSCLTWVEERKDSFGQVISHHMSEWDYVVLSLSIVDDDERTTSNSFSFDRCERMCGQSPSTGLERWRAFSRSSRLESFERNLVAMNARPREKENERKSKNGISCKTGWERERKRENGQLLLFDGQSTDDKHYAIVIAMVFLL